MNKPVHIKLFHNEDSYIVPAHVTAIETSSSRNGCYIFTTGRNEPFHAYDGANKVKEKLFPLHYEVPDDLEFFINKGRKYIFALDTSGSENDNKIKAEISLIKKIVKENHLVSCLIIPFDHIVYGALTVEECRYEKLQGGGGSDTRKLFEVYNKSYKENYDGLVVFTDGYTSFVDNTPNFRHLIVVDNNETIQKLHRDPHNKVSHLNFTSFE